MWKKLTEAQGAVIAAIIAGIFLCIVAIVGLGNPIVEKWAERQFRDTPTPAPFPPTNAPIPTSSEPEKIDTQVTQGGVSKNYSMTLEDGEILVGHADKFQSYEGCVAYLIVGPGEFNFSVKSGLWDRWINVTPDLYNSLLKEQSDTLVNKYSCTLVKIVKCDSECTESEP